MKLLRRARGRIGESFQNPAVVLLAAVCFVILLYSVFAYPFYTAVKVAEIKEAYRMLSEIDFAELTIKDEEDMEILKGLSDDRLGILITDDEFQVVYSNRKKPVHQERIIERYMIPYEECFQEEPDIYIRKNRRFLSIRLRSRLIQGEGFGTEGFGEPGSDAQKESEEQKVYYVYVRLVVRSVGTAIRYTTKYLCAVGLMFFLGYMMLRIKGMRLALVPERVYEEKLYGGKYNSGTDSAARPGSMPGHDIYGRGPEKEKNLLRQESPGKNENSEEGMKARQEFVASVSHELKTPLAVISGQMEMLQSMGDRIDQDYYFTSIREEIDKMSRMVGNLLDLTIMEHQMEDMELREMDFSGMAQYMVQKYDALFQRNRVSLSTEIEEGCVVYGNRTYLEQAVNNYIMNAFQHTPQGKGIRITLVRESDSAKLCVYNEGSSVPDEELGQIWKGFYKESGNSRINLREFRNAGLGLYFVKKITEIHHGDCGVQNTDEGVEFWLTLPLMGRNG